jgi:DNA repair exonuclease SbcCD ATPase subunit
MNTSIEIIQRIGQKLQLLIRQRDGLLRDKERQQQELLAKQHQIDALNEKVNTLEDHLAILKNASMQMNDKDKKDFEKRINGFIKDIDKVVAHLQA